MRLLYLHGVKGSVDGEMAGFLQRQASAFHAVDLHEIATLGGLPRMARRGLSPMLRRAAGDFARFQPDVVVAHSFGGCLALRMNLGGAGLVLIAPCWKPRTALVYVGRTLSGVVGRRTAGWLGAAAGIVGGAAALPVMAPLLAQLDRFHPAPPGTRVVHSPEDGFIPLADSRELLRRSGLAQDRLLPAPYDGDAPPDRRPLDAHRMHFPAAHAALRAALDSFAR